MLALLSALANLTGCGGHIEKARSTRPIDTDYQIKLITEPRIKALQNHDLFVKIIDSKSLPVAEADVTATLTMPTMTMPPNVVQLMAVKGKPGEYGGTMIFTMSGAWTLTLDAKKAGAELGHVTANETVL